MYLFPPNAHISHDWRWIMQTADGIFAMNRQGDPPLTLPPGKAVEVDHLHFEITPPNLHAVLREKEMAHCYKFGIIGTSNDCRLST